MAARKQEWSRTADQANALQKQADNLYEQAEELQCPKEFWAAKERYSNVRCQLDVGHTGSHEVPNE